MPKPMPVAVLEAKKEGEDPLKGMQQARGYADTLRFDVKYVFSTNGHKYGEYDRFTELINGPFLLPDFPGHPDLRARYCKDCGIDLTQPSAAILFQPDSPACRKVATTRTLPFAPRSRRSCLTARQAQRPRAALARHRCGQDHHRRESALAAARSRTPAQARACSCATATSCASRPTPSSRPSSATTPASSRTENGENAAKNARIHIATYQTLGLDDDDDGFASFLTEHYPRGCFQRHHHRRVPPLRLGQVVGGAQAQPQRHPHRPDRHAAPAATSSEEQAPRKTPRSPPTTSSTSASRSTSTR